MYKNEENDPQPHNFHPSIPHHIFALCTLILPETMTSSLNIEISLKEDRTFTTSDQIDGEAFIPYNPNIAPHHIRISLVGVTRIIVDALSPSSGRPRPQQTLHQFLELEYNDIKLDCTPGQVAQNTSHCRIPFQFTIPERLLENQCSHNSSLREVAGSHRFPPPSLNDEEEQNDNSNSHGASIRYRIVVQVFEGPRVHGNVETRLLGVAGRRIHFIPSLFRGQSMLDHELPTMIDRDDGLCMTERVTKGRFHASFVTPAVIFSHQEVVELQVILKYVGSKSDKPPPSCAHTSLSVSATSRYGTMDSRDLVSDTALVGRQSDTVKTSLVAHHRTELAWRQSSTRDAAEWQTEIRMPVNLPKKIFDIPSFDSCLVSQRYTLHISTSVGRWCKNETVATDVPVWVAHGESPPGYDHLDKAMVET